MAGGRGKDAQGGRPIIIKREEVVEGGHHGGAWKVAYADFVTAMMAFFLLMWLLNATTEEQRRGLADYFSPANIFSHTSSGNGQPFGGRTPYADGNMASDRGAAQIVNGRVPPQPDVEEDDTDTPATAPVYHRDGTTEPSIADRDRGRARANAPPGHAEREAHGVAGGAEAVGQQQKEQQARQQAAHERAALESAAEQLRARVAADPELAPLARQLAIDMTPEGLRIQLLDEDQIAMFATGSAAPNERAKLLLQKIAPVLQGLSEKISISGHTDATPFAGRDRSNWDLSTERANATRKLLVEAGLPEDRIRSVTGNADRDPLLPADPFAAANRRIAITVLRQTRPAPAPTPDGN